jgi:Bacterial type II and III secretion system protein
MNRLALIVGIALVLCSTAVLLAQTGKTSAERKAFREYTSPQELVSIAPSTSLDKALAAISEVSQKFVGKVIIDPDRRSMPINIDIQGLQWRDALESILRKNNLWYSEYETYIQISSMAPSEGGGVDRVMVGGGGAAVGSASPDITREAANFRSREIKISAVFFEVNLDRAEEVGINWTFMKTTSDVAVASEFLAADKVSDKMFKLDVVPKVSFANMEFLLRMFSNYSLGEILSGPSLIVRSGEEGRIQVGQDFSIRERDFAGNLLDKFYSAGTIIKVTPQVITEQGVNFVHLMVDVERSSVTPGPVSTIINKTKATTNVLLLDGEETVIGGLYNNETSTQRQGVPFLKDLPWYVFGLRYLFGYDVDKITKKELVILLKADLVPTLQERITQKTREDDLVSKWREEVYKKEQRIKSDRAQPKE